MKFYDDDEIWDEFQWEGHLADLEERNEQIKGFLKSTLNDNNEPRWLRLLDEYNSELDLMNAYIEEELLIEDSYFPDDEDWEEEDDELDDPMFDLLGQDDMDEDELDDEAEDLFGTLDNELDELDELEEWDFEGEEWKSLSDDFAMSDYGSIEQLDVYVKARDLGAEIFRLVDHRKNLLRTVELQQFISNLVQVSAKLAGGYAFGFEVDVLGANIAYSKRALNYANTSLENLQSLKGEKIFSKKDYLKIHATLFEVRNDIGIYIQELRSRFYSSI